MAKRQAKRVRRELTSEEKRRWENAKKEAELDEEQAQRVADADEAAAVDGEARADESTRGLVAGDHAAGAEGADVGKLRGQILAKLAREKGVVLR